MLVQLLINGLISGAVYAIAALGFALIYRSTRIFHIAHAAVYTAAAYFLYLFYNQWHMPLWFSILMAIVMAGALGIVMEVTVYFPLYRDEAAASVMLVSSIGIMTVVVNLIAMIWGNETKIVISGISPTFQFPNPFAAADSAFKQIIVTLPQVFQLAVSLLVIAAVMLILRKTRPGKKIRAICDNDQLVEIFAISLRKYRVLIFFLGSAMAGLASVLVAVDVGMDPYVGMPILLIAAVAVIVGGVDTFFGAVLGGFLLGFARALVIWKMSARWENMIVFILLILFLLLRPEGLLGRKKRGV